MSDQNLLKSILSLWKVDYTDEILSWYCSHCSIEFNPDNENVKRKSKIAIPEKNTEKLVSTTPGTDYLRK